MREYRIEPEEEHGCCHYYVCLRKELEGQLEVGDVLVLVDLIQLVQDELLVLENIYRQRRLQDQVHRY